MIDAVNTFLSGIQTAKASTSQGAGFSAELESVNPAPQAPFVSPYISVDLNFNRAVLQIRDSDTGDVLRQFPSESRLEQIQRQARSAEQAEQQTQTEQASDLQGLGDTTETAFVAQSLSFADTQGVPTTNNTPAQSQIASSAFAQAQLTAQSFSSGVNVTA